MMDSLCKPIPRDITPLVDDVSEESVGAEAISEFPSVSCEQGGDTPVLKAKLSISRPIPRPANSTTSGEGGEVPLLGQKRKAGRHPASTGGDQEDGRGPWLDDEVAVLLESRIALNDFCTKGRRKEGCSVYHKLHKRCTEEWSLKFPGSGWRRSKDSCSQKLAALERFYDKLHEQQKTSGAGYVKGKWCFTRMDEYRSSNAKIVCVAEEGASMVDKTCGGKGAAEIGVQSDEESEEPVKRPKKSNSASSLDVQCIELLGDMQRDHKSTSTKLVELLSQQGENQNRLISVFERVFLPPE